ncbi:hypothetical protein [Cupriavidus sp. DL-D2]|uniref:hypothetical protein n=1 Tax=Cupriavidus sp. DL-D2 TaxID=3144974 RepID=UPI0032134025
MRLTRIYLIAAAVAAISIIGSYAALYRYQLGAPILASYDVKNWLRLKERVAANTQGSKILMVGDSNVLFGFDSTYAQSKLGRPVVNMGLHGGLPMDWILSVAVRNAKPGDTVVFPLVWLYYTSDYSAPSDWMLDQIVAWDVEYLNSLPFNRRLKYFTALSPLKLVQNVDTQMNRGAVLKANPHRKLLPKDEALAYYDQVASMQTAFSYTYLNMNARGDMRHTCGHLVEVSGASYPPPAKAKVNPKTVKLMVDTIKLLRARGVQAYVSASVVVDDETTRAPRFQKLLTDIWGELRSNGVPLIGSPTDYFFPPHAFFNTNFHLNCDATRARTEIFVKKFEEAVNASSGANADVTPTNRDAG